jgi:branched-chain amino acid transport system substrate-binding protein
MAIVGAVRRHDRNVAAVTGAGAPSGDHSCTRTAKGTDVTQLDRREALRLLATLGAAGVTAPVLSACGDDGSGGSGSLAPVKIGVVMPQTGVLKSDGDDLGNGFRLYLKRTGGTLGGRLANVVFVDEGQGVETGTAAVDTLINNEKVVAISGVVSSAVMTAVKDKVEAARIPLVGSNASPSSLRGTNYIWRTSWAATDPGSALGRYVAENVNGTVATIAPDYQAGRDFVEGFRRTFVAAGGKLEEQQHWTPFIPTPSTDFLPYLAKIKTSSAKAVYCFYAGALATAFIKQYRQMGLTQTLYAAGFLTEGQPLKAAGADAAGIYTVMNYSSDLDNPANRSFSVDYHKEHNSVPTTFAMAAFDAANVLDRAIRIAGPNLTTESLNKAIGQVGEIKSPRGSWQFGANRTPVQRWYLRQVRLDGSVLSNVMIAELATLDGSL